MIVEGGKVVSGAPVGILMLETRFPRLPGDIGNALTWPFPVLYRVVRDASPEQVVRRRAEGLLDAFIEAGRALVADGAEAITTSCGFLSPMQAQLSAELGVPVASSALMMVPLVESILPPGRCAGVLTISAADLSPDHLSAAGASPRTPVAGVDPGGEFARVVLGNLPRLDVAAARAEIRAAAAALRAGHPEVGAVVLECTNMSPFAREVRAVAGCPVFSIVDLVCWLHAGLAPRAFPEG